MLKKVVTTFLIVNLWIYSFVDDTKKKLYANLNNANYWNFQTESVDNNWNQFLLYNDYSQLLQKLLPFFNISYLLNNKFDVFQNTNSFVLKENSVSIKSKLNIFDSSQVESSGSSNYLSFDNVQLQKELNWNYYDETQSQDYIKISSFISSLIDFNKIQLEESQYLTFVDTNKQLMYIIYYFKDNNSFEILWKDLVTTWDYKLWNKFFNTPHLIIDRSMFVKNDWKAEWTWKMWFWPKWSRIRYLWDHIINKSWTKFATETWWWYFRLSLAIHTSNKNWDKKLWSRVSHWCVRVSKFMLNFLDKTWILDWKAWKYLIIWDSNSDITQIKVIQNNS